MKKTNEELILLSGRDKLKRKKPVRFLIAYVVSVLCITLAASMALVFGQTPATISSIFNISIEQTAGGQIISEDENLATTKEIVNAGENKSFIIAPDEGYYVTKLVIDGVSYDVLNYGQSFNYVFEKVNSEHSILATFEQKSFGRITVTQSDNGAITPESISINYGDSQEFTITPNEGYEITNITIDGQPVAITVNSGEAQKYSFNDIQADHTITATFSIRVFAITVNQSENGIISPSNSVVNYGSNQTFTITPDEGYKITSILIDYGTQNAKYINITAAEGDSQSFTFEDINNAHSITATFGIRVYSVYLTPPSNGTINPGNLYQSYSYGTSLSFTITPKENYRIERIIVNGIDIDVTSEQGESQIYTIDGITRNMQIAVIFGLKNYTVTFIDYDNTILNVQEVDHFGSAVPPTITREGYRFTGWDQSYKGITENKTLTAQYVKQWTVTFIDWNGDLLKTQTVDQGTNASAPESNPRRLYDDQYFYIFSGWDKSYNNVTSDLIVTAQYSSILRSFTIEFLGINGKVSTKIENVVYGTKITPPANPTKTDIENDYTFEGWEIQGESGVIYTYEDIEQLSITRSIIFAPKFSESRKTFTVEFRDIDGSTIPVNGENIQIVMYGEDAIAPPDPIPPEEYAFFTGWDYGYTYVTRDLIITATYDAPSVKFRVDFENYNGIKVGSEDVSVNSSLSLSQIPVAGKIGYKLTGWKIKDGDGTNYTSNDLLSYKVIGAITFVAQFDELIEYEITYYSKDTNGELVLLETTNPSSYNIESESITLENPVRNGYTFLGWTCPYPDGNFNNPLFSVTIPTGSYGDRKYVANWEVINFSIEYDFNGGDELYPNPTSYNVESNSITLNNPLRPGYIFLGWTCVCEDYPNFSFTTPLTSVTIPTGSYGDRKYTANWEVITYNIKVYIQGEATPLYTIIFNIEDLELGPITLEEPEVLRHNFTGWTGTDISKKTLNFSINTLGDKEYTAWFSPTVYSITFDLDGGHFKSGSYPKINEFIIETSIDQLIKTVDDIPVWKTGYTFLGWICICDYPEFSFNEPQKEISIGLEDYGNRTYIAQWAEQLEVRFFDDDGNIIQVEGQNFQYIDKGFAGVTVPDAVVKEHHTFLGWTIQGGDENVTYTSEQVEAMLITDNITFIAKSEPQKEVRFFDDDGNIIQIEGQDVQYVDSEFVGITVPGAVVKEYHTFLGWTIQGGDENVTYTLEQVEAMLITDNITFVAKSEPIEYEITYDLNDNDTGEADFEGEYPVKYNVTTETFTLVEPRWAGHRFLGWTGEGLTTPTLEVVIPKGSNGDKTYTAEWIDQFTVTFVDYDGTTNLSTQVVDEGSFAIAPEEDPTRAGYVFFGWTVEGGDGTIYFSREVDLGIEGSYISEFTIMQNTIFKAYYINAHTVTFEYPGEVEVYVDGIIIDKDSPLTVDVGHGMPLKSKKSEVPQIASIDKYISGWIIEGDISETFYTHEDILKLGIEDGITFIHRQTLAFDIAVTQTENGIISPSDAKVCINYNQDFVITPNVGYKISSIIVDGVEIPVTALEGESQTYTFENVQADRTITATFEIRKFNITISQVTGASISGPKTVSYGQKAAYTINAETAYLITQLIINGDVIMIGNKTYTHIFDNVQANHSISVKVTKSIFDGGFGIIEKNGKCYINAVPEYNGQPLTIYSIINNEIIYGLTDSVTNLSGYSEVIIEDNIQTIGRAFYGCSNLKTVTFGNNSQLKSIGESAFYDCTSLTSITIPANVTDIGNNAFRRCWNLKNLTFKENSQLKSIGVSAFIGCTSLQSITIPASVTTLQFNSLNNIAFNSIDVDPDNQNYSSLDGVLFNKDKTILITCPRGKTGHYFFPNSVKNIGEGAFAYCRSLTSMTFEENSQLKIIGKEAFKEVKLTSITIPASVTSIGWCAFEQSALETVIFEDNSQLTIIEFNAFHLCGSLTSITIPSSVTNIRDSAFYRCRSLITVTFEENSQLTSIGAYAFYGCESLESITIPASMTSIVYSAFNSCYNLKTVTFEENSQLKYIGESAFYQCFNLISITIPASVTNIGNSAFANCSSLISITLPASIKYIGDAAFEYCSSLTKMIVKAINAPFLNLNGWVFEFSNNIRIYVPTLSLNAYKLAWSVYKDKIFGYESLSYGLLFDKDGTVLLMAIDFESENYEIPESVETIDDHAFAGCTGLTSIIIPEGVTNIGNNAFYWCTSLTSINVDPNNEFYSSTDGVLFNKDKTVLIAYPAGKSNISYSILTSVISIEDYAFAHCSSLKSITIPASVTSIGDSAFSSCSSLTSITIPDSVTSIGSDAFKYCENLTTVTFEENSQLSYISYYAFYGCESLESINIPNSVTSIKDYSFADCSSLQSITIPASVKSIETGAFQECTSLTSIIIPASVTSIGEDTNSYYSGVFYNCTSLTTVIFEENSQLTIVGDYAFNGCTSLTSITIPASVTIIGENAFDVCTSLTTVIFEENSNLEQIGHAAFMNCLSLTSIIIPASVTSIEWGAFGNCQKLTLITFNATVPPTLKTFAIPSNVSKIYVPGGSVNAYKTASGWSAYASKIFAIGS